MAYRYQSGDAGKSELAYGPNSVQPALPSEEVHRLCKEYKESLALSEAEITKISADTSEQGSSSLWLQLRRSRLTSSNFGVVCKRRASTPVANLVKNLLYRSISSNVSSLRWERENEDTARMAYCTEMAARGTPVSTQRVGLIISAEKPHLACSPDDLVEDKSISNKHGTVEYKCPYSARELSPVEACMKIKNFYCKFEDGNKTFS